MNKSVRLLKNEPRNSLMKIANIEEANSPEYDPTKEKSHKKIPHFFMESELRLPNISRTRRSSILKRSNPIIFGLNSRKGFVRDEEMCSLLGDILKGDCENQKSPAKKALTIEMRRIGAPRKTIFSQSPLLSFRELLLGADTSRIQAKDLAICGKMELETRKRMIIRECLEMMFQIIRFPFETISLQLRGLELIGDILIEFRSYNQALYYYLRGKTHAENKQDFTMKMVFLKKAALCYKELQLHEQALFLFKKLMQLTWDREDHSRELEVYDLIGMEYYYMGKIEKAIYYHNRMMKGEMEGDTQEKALSLAKLGEFRRARSYKRQVHFTSLFEEYNWMRGSESTVLPHEQSRELLRMVLRRNAHSKPQTLVSPCFRGGDLKQNILEEARHEVTGEGTSKNIHKLSQSLDQGPKISSSAQNKKIKAVLYRLLKNKLRIFNITSNSRKYQTGGRTAIGRIKERNKSCIETKQRPLNVPIDSCCNYSHLSFSRGKILQTTILNSGYMSVTHKLEDFGRFMVLESIEYLMKSGPLIYYLHLETLKNQILGIKQFDRVFSYCAAIWLEGREQQIK